MLRSPGEAMRFLHLPLLLGMVGVVPAADSPTVTVTDISQDGKMLSAAAINKWGDVAGQGDLGDGLHALLLQDGVLIDLGSVPGRPTSQAFALNDRGEVAGAGYVAAPAGSHALLWSKRGVQDLNPVGSFSSAATGINQRGQVVGWHQLASSVRYAALWEGERLTSLGSGQADGINRRGTIVGGTLVWDGSSVVNLGTGYETAVTSINDRGDVAGYHGWSFAFGEGLLWEDGVRRPLPPLYGDTKAFAYGINGRGQVVGASVFCEWECNDPRSHAVLWQDGQAVHLPPLPGDSESVAHGINDRGEIVGTSFIRYCVPPCEPRSRAVVWRVE